MNKGLVIGKCVMTHTYTITGKVTLKGVSEEDAEHIIAEWIKFNTEHADNIDCDLHAEKIG